MFFRTWIIKNKKNSFFFEGSELNKLVLKSLLRDLHFSYKDRIYFSILLNNFSIASSGSIFRRSCLVSGYPKSVFRFFRLSRHCCKSFASYGFLSGMRKSSF